MIPIQFKRLTKSAKIPAYQTPGAAAVDFYADLPEFSVTLTPGSQHTITLGYALYIGDPRYALLIVPRSGLGAKHGIVLPHNVGLIDSDYQGELVVPLVNRGDRSFTINHGDRIAQGFFLPVQRAMFQEVEAFSAVTERGAGGFGSTGIATVEVATVEGKVVSMSEYFRAARGLGSLGEETAA
jgi:dUTP pyrophosphatase